MLANFASAFHLSLRGDLANEVMLSDHDPAALKPDIELAVENMKRVPLNAAQRKSSEFSVVLLSFTRDGLMQE